MREVDDVAAAPLGATVVVAAYNEASVIADVVLDVRRVFDHVVVVDDGSSDGTAAVARAAGADVVRHPLNLGQGAALVTGIRHALAASPEYVVTFDADGQHRAADAAAMVARARQEDVQVVLGSRSLGSSNAGGARRALLRAATWFTRVTSGLDVTDAHNGLRVIRADAAAGLTLRLHGMSHASEILGRIGAEGWSYVEHPVTIDYTDYSVTKGQRSYNALNILYDLAVDRLRATA